MPCVRKKLARENQRTSRPRRCRQRQMLSFLWTDSPEHQRKAPPRMVMPLERRNINAIGNRRQHWRPISQRPDRDILRARNPVHPRIRLHGMQCLRRIPLHRQMQRDQGRHTRWRQIIRRIDPVQMHHIDRTVPQHRLGRPPNRCMCPRATHGLDRAAAEPRDWHQPPRNRRPFARDHGGPMTRRYQPPINRRQHLLRSARPYQVKPPRTETRSAKRLAVHPYRRSISPQNSANSSATCGGAV